MKKRRKIKLKYKKDRVLLSDVLPYELPIIMSNRMLYRFCVKNKIRYNVKDRMLEWDKNIDYPSFEVLKLFFQSSFEPSKIPTPCDGQTKLSIYSTIPFVFHILHKESEYRALSIIHPAMQIGMVTFYDEFKQLIIHYCNRSRYSIRHPHTVASYFYYKDKLHSKLLGTKKDKIELFFNEYENLKTFFSYKKYTQIFRFYDDYRFQRAEKRFKHLLRFDIQKCFDSIYTHTIAWATQGGKDAYKESFKGKDSISFGGIFDSLMQRLNYNETNGIVIGPEFSRIFAEIILQHIDRTVEYKLKTKGIFYGTDYQLYRYVDDYFLFYNDEKVKSHAIDSFQLVLEEYKLKISREKTVEYQRPFLTDISRAKIRIDSLIDHWFKYRSDVRHSSEMSEAEEKDIVEECESEDNNLVPDINRINKILDETGYYPLVSRKFNQQYKDILTTTGVKPKDVINYTLSCIFTRINRELKCFDQKYKCLKLITFNKLPELETIRERCSIRLIKMERQLSRFLIDAIDSAFFLFTLNCRLNSTLKLTRILNVIIIYLKGIYRVKDKTICSRFNNDFRNEIFGQIHLEVINVLSRFKCLKYAQLEILYLLIVMKSINSTHPISAELLTEHLCMSNNNSTFNLSIIAINVIIYYIGNKKQYNGIKDELINQLKRKIQNKGGVDFTKDTECIVLILDVACCPYFSVSQKQELFSKMNLTNAQINHLIEFGKQNKYFFTKWTGVDVTKELAAKISQEVYS